MSHPLPRITKRIEFKAATPEPVFPTSVPKISQRIDFMSALSQLHSSDNAASLHSAEAVRDDPKAMSDQDTEDLDAFDDGEDEEDRSNNSDDEEMESISIGVIMKPQGEPGRPQSGGYTLSTVLTGWTPKFYKQVNVCFSPHPNTFFDTRRRNLSS